MHYDANVRNALTVFDQRAIALVRGSLNSLTWTCAKEVRAQQHNSRKEPEDKLECGRGTKEIGMGSKLLDRWLRSRWQRTLALRWLRWIVTANFSESSMQVSNAGHLRLLIKAIEFSIWSFVVGTFLNHRATVSELFELSSSCLCSCKYLGKL